MDRIIQKQQKRFRGFYNVPYRCDICGDFRDPANPDSEKFFLTCSNKHILCPSHLELFENINLSDIREFAIENHKEWYEKHQKDNDSTFLKKFQNLNKLSSTELSEREDEYCKILYKTGKETVKSRKLKKIPSIICPICMLRVVNEHELLIYLLEKWHFKKEDIIKEMQIKFKDLEHFCNSFKDLQENIKLGGKNG